MAIRAGDPIIKMRAAGADPCGTLPAPFMPSFSVVTGGTLTGLLYFLQTWFTPWGETLPSPEQFAQLGSGNSLVVSNQVVPGAIKMRVYYGLQAGAEFQYQDLDLEAAGIMPGQTATMTIASLFNAGGSRVPTKSSAWLADSDGTFVPASIAFAWLNQALRRLTVTLGGIRDISGVAWPSQAAWQVLKNRWTEIENLWWQGWWQVIGEQAYTWLVNPITSVPGYFTQWSNAGEDTIGLWPQPGQGPVSTTLSANAAPGDTTLNIVPIAPSGPEGIFTMPGMVVIDEEFILISAQNSAGTQIVGCLRGKGGTSPQAHLAGATVTQLIVMFTGTRTPPDFSPGCAYNLLQLPAGWDVPLDTYMMAKYREKEQDVQAFGQLMGQFKQEAEDLRSSRDAVPKNRQIGDSRVYEAFAGYRSSFPFSILIP